MKRAAFFVFTLCLIVCIMAGCQGQMKQSEYSQSTDNGTKPASTDEMSEQIVLGSEFVELSPYLSGVEFVGDDFFEEFLKKGGASTDSDVVAFLVEKLGISEMTFDGAPFGCSTIAVESPNGERLFGRNFDWNLCNALIIRSKPENGYASISTVNIDFIQGASFSYLPCEAKALIALYAPLDGMNEKGLAVSVNMISDGSTIAQNTEKPDITTTTAIRLLLNKAATVDEAVALLKEYDFHASMNFMIHLAIADADGNSVVVEYIDNEMSVVETPIVTNFYLTEGEKYGIGTQQSHTRFEILEEKLKGGTMSMDAVRDALSSVSKGNFGEFESTEWSIVFNQTTGEVHYYHRENYENRYTFTVK
ncbi:MAG: linear amide C-N hydrolase [Clostridium sp.]|nr:linear amide C-N hydrolase [Clostridium sp.]